jgi:hypothetical protein
VEYELIGTVNFHLSEVMDIYFKLNTIKISMGSWSIELSKIDDEIKELYISLEPLLNELEEVFK